MLLQVPSPKPRSGEFATGLLLAISRYRDILRAVWAVWLAGIVWGSLISAGRLNSLEETLPFLAYDKLVHFGAYAGLGLLSLLGFARPRGVYVALSMILLGGFVEFGQSLSPGRTPDLTDALANTLGVLAGLAIGLRLLRRA